MAEDNFPWLKTYPEGVQWQFECEYKPVYALLEETADLEAAFPERMHSFIANGNSHTFLLYDTSITAGGVTVLDWVSAMLDGSPDWVSTSD